MNEEFHDVFSNIYNYFGYENQRRKLQEEVLELNDEILKYETGQGDIQDVITELGDVANLIYEIQSAYDISNDELSDACAAKITRTLERIASGYYGNGKSD